MSTHSVPGAFGCGAIQFVCDRKFTNVRLPGSETEQFDCYAAELTASNCLPELNGVPVAAWLLARLAALSGDRFPGLPLRKWITERAG